MLHELDGHRFQNEFSVRTPCGQDIALFYDRREALLLSSPDGEMRLPTFAQVLSADPEAARASRYLFSVDDRAFFWAPGLNPAGIPGASMQPIDAFRTLAPQHMGFAGITGSHLYRFYQDNQFCGRCAAPMEPSQTERALVCPVCGLTVYPKISPAVIVGVVDGDRLLLTKYAGRTHANYALVAGFAEFGEPIEHTVAREVMEEVGLCVTNIRYYKSQPWPFSDSLLLGFFCDLDGEGRITLDERELGEARWFDRRDLPLTENTMSLTNTMIEAFRRAEMGVWPFARPQTRSFSGGNGRALCGESHTKEG